MRRMTQDEIIRFFLAGSHNDTALLSLVCMGAGHDKNKVLKRIHREANRISIGESSKFLDAVMKKGNAYISQAGYDYEALAYWSCDTIL